MYLRMKRKSPAIRSEPFEVFDVFWLPFRAVIAVEDEEHGEVTDDWQHDTRQAFEGGNAMQRNWNAQRHHQIAKDGFVADLRDGGG
jgi:hypothetical protein